MQSERLKELPPYLFVEIDRQKEARIRSGRRVLDLGIGDPDFGAPPELIQYLNASLECLHHHRYPPQGGTTVLVDAIRHWAGAVHGVALEREEVLVTIGSKEAIGHLPLAVVNPGETVLVPDPGYPVYHSSAVLAGADSVRLPLEESNQFWPDLDAVGPSTADAARLVFLNYPNNPTAAMAGQQRFLDAIRFCRDHDIILVNDAAYAEITYDRPAVALFPLAREENVPYIELYSFSKTFSITGWRVGFAIGARGVIAALARVKANIDSGVFGAVQEAVAKALASDFETITRRILAVYRERRDILAGCLKRASLTFAVPEATFYFWVRTPGDMGSIEFCAFLLDKLGIVATPGIGFGEHGEGYFRLSITVETETVREAGRLIETLPEKLVRG